MSDAVQSLYLRIGVVGAAEAEGEVDDVTVSIERLGEASETTGKKLKGGGLFSALTSLKGLMAAAGVFEAVKSYSAFTSQMMKLRTQTGATTAEMHRQSQAVMGMATQVGTGPTSLAQGLYHLESASIRGAKATNDLRIAAEGAQVGGASLTDTVTSLTAAMLAFGKRGLSARDAMGQLNAIVGAGDMTWTDLNDALGTGVLATLKTLGLKLNDFGAAMAVFGDNNIRGAAAANRLRMSLMTLVHPSEAAKEAMASIGLGPTQLAQDLRQPNGLLVMLDTLHQRLDGLSKVSQETVLASIFGGGKNSAGILTLYGEMDRLNSKYAALHAGQMSFDQDWRDTQRTLAFSLSQLKALGEVLLIKVGGALSGVVSDGARLIEWLAQGHGAATLLRSALIGLAAAWALNATAMKLFGADATIASVATGILNADLIVTIGSITSLTDVLAALSMAIDAVPIVGWIAAGITALVLLITHFKQVKHIAVDAFHEVAKAGTFLYKEVLLPIWKVIEKIFNFISGKGGTLSKIFSFLNPVGEMSHIAHGIAGMFANGGQTPVAGSFIVGERGPELINLPAGAQISPANSQATLAAMNGSGGPTQLEATVPFVIQMDGRHVGQGIGRAALQEQARM